MQPIVDRPSLFARVLRLRPEDGAPIALGAAVYFLLLTANYSLRPVRDALALTSGADDLPWLFTGTFLTVLAVTPLFGWAASRYGRPRLIPIIYRTCAIVLIGFYFALEHGPREEAAAGFFIWMSVFNLYAISLLWSVMADRFPEKDARRVFGLVALGGSAGALLGPTLAAATSQLLSPSLMLPFAAVMLELGIRIGRPLWQSESAAEDAARPLGGGSLAGLVQVWRSRQLQMICLYLLLMTTISTVAYFEQGHIVEGAFTTEADRTTALAGIDILVNVLTFAGQALITGRVLSKFGLTIALVALPLVSAIGLGLLALAPVFWALALFQILRRASNYVLSKPAREVLFTAVSRAERYKAKSFIDTVVYRGGDALAGWGFAGLLAVGLGLSGIAWVTLPLALVWAVAGALMGRRHARTHPDPDDVEPAAGG